jgi:predicted nucleotidyltransferase
MSASPLAQRERELLRGVFPRHPAVTAVRIFGSRAEGNPTPGSEIDWAVWGDVDDLRAEAIAAALDELALPYHYDVKPCAGIKLRTLREPIERVGIVL